MCSSTCSCFLMFNIVYGTEEPAPSLLNWKIRNALQPPGDTGTQNVQTEFRKPFLMFWRQLFHIGKLTQGAT